MAKRKDIIIEIIAIEKKLLRADSEKSSQNNFINNPKIKIGKLEIKR